MLWEGSGRLLKSFDGKNCPSNNPHGVPGVVAFVVDSPRGGIIDSSSKFLLISDSNIGVQDK